VAGKGTVTVRILGDNRDLSRALNDSESKLGRFAGGAGKLFKAGAIGIGALGVGALIVGPQILEAGAKLEALGIKSATVFGDSLGDVQKWADGVAGSMGLTSAELTGAAAGMGDLLKPMGFTSKEAADMSSEMLDLSGALSAWSGGQRDATEVADIFAKAMLGETDGLKGLGISISAAEIEARLLSKGQKELTGTALAQAKALATQELIMEKSTDAQAAWTDGSMDSIKAQNESKASIAQLKEQFVQGLYPAIQAILPVLTKAATWLGEHLPAAFAFAQAAGERITSWFERNWPTIQATIQAVVEWLRTVAWPIIQEVAGFIVTEFSALVKAVRDNWESISETIDGVIEAVRLIVETGVAIIQNLWATFGDTLLRYVVDGWAAIKRIIGAALQTIQGIINTVTALIRGDWSAVWDGIKQTFNGVWNSIKAIVSAALTTVRAVISLAWDGIKATFGGAIDGLKEKWNGFWNGLKGVVSGVVGGIKQAIQPIIDFIQNIIDKAVAAKNAIASLNPFGKNTVSLADNVLGSTGSRLSSGSSVPRMASGGLAFSPMLAVVGDNRNARRDPEVIAPGSMIAGIVRRELDRDRSDVQRSSVVINLMDRFQVEAVVSQRDADLLMSLEAGMR